MSTRKERHGRASGSQDRKISAETMTAALEVANDVTDRVLMFFDTLAGDAIGTNSAPKLVLDQLLSMALDVGIDAFAVSRRDLHIE